MVCMYFTSPYLDRERWTNEVLPLAFPKVVAYPLYQPWL